MWFTRKVYTVARVVDKGEPFEKKPEDSVGRFLPVLRFDSLNK